MSVYIAGLGDAPLADYDEQIKAAFCVTAQLAEQIVRRVTDLVGVIQANRHLLDLVEDPCDLDDAIAWVEDYTTGLGWYAAAARLDQLDRDAR